MSSGYDPNRQPLKGPAVTSLMIYWGDKHERLGMVTDPPDEAHDWVDVTPALPSVGDLIFRRDPEGATPFRVSYKFYAYDQVGDSEVTTVFIRASPIPSTEGT